MPVSNFDNPILSQTGSFNISSIIYVNLGHTVSGPGSKMECFGFVSPTPMSVERA